MSLYADPTPVPDDAVRGGWGSGPDDGELVFPPPPWEDDPWPWPCIPENFIDRWLILLAAAEREAAEPEAEPLPPIRFPDPPSGFDGNIYSLGEWITGVEDPDWGEFWDGYARGVHDRTQGVIDALTFGWGGDLLGPPAL